MNENYDFDVAVVGGGPGGYVAAIRAAGLGARTCLVERGALGGVCTNAGCIPTKVLYQSARMMLGLGAADEFGLDVGAVELRYPRLAERRDKIVQRLRKGVAGLLSGSGVEMIRASAGFEDAHTLRCAGDQEDGLITAQRFILATGSSPVQLPGLPFDHERVINSADAVSAGELPESIIIVGGGYIGCEFASVYAALGVQVTLVEMLDHLLPGLDRDCAAQVKKGIKKLGGAVYTGATLDGLDTTAGGVTASLSDNRQVSAEQCLICVGRRPDCSGLNISEAGLQAGENGQVPTNEHMQTSQPHIYAVGDVAGPPLLAHVASREGIVAASHATGAISARMDYRVVPACVFAFPEIATVGITEAEATESGRQTIVKKFPFRALGKAHILGDTGGFAKLIADARTGRLLGAHICGPQAGALVGEAALALQMEATAEELCDTIHAHPTWTESLHEAAQGIVGLPINWKG